MFEPEEIISIVIVSVSLSFFLSLPLFNFSKFFFTNILFFVIFFVFVLTEKIVAEGLDYKLKIKLLTFSRYGFRPEETLGFEFPLWFVLPLLSYILTFGRFIWTAVLNFDIEGKDTRVRRKFYEPTEKDIAKIAISGPLALLILGFLMYVIKFKILAYLCVLTSFLYFLPVGQGIKIYAGMRITSIFLLVLSLAILLLMNIFSPLATLLLGLLIAIICIISYYVLWEK